MKYAGSDSEKYSDMCDALTAEQMEQCLERARYILHDMFYEGNITLHFGDIVADTVYYDIKEPYPAFCYFAEVTDEMIEKMRKINEDKK